MVSSPESPVAVEPRLPRGPSVHFEFEALPDFFIHADPTMKEDVIGPVPARFGLLDASPGRWKNLNEKLDSLEQEFPDAKIKVIWAGRHGQGWHNLAEEKYGNKAWNEYWSMLNGDGEIVWGPDPQLTPLGEEQAQVAHDVWEAELGNGIPLPQSLYSSPFSRALSTAKITFAYIGAPSHLLESGQSSSSPIAKPPPILIVENVRETNGKHTCDKRNTLSYITRTYVERTASPKFVVEEGLTEEDELWTEEREPDEHVRERVVDVLDRIFEHDPSRYISITAHSGWITQLLAATQYRKYNLPTGGVIPLVVKAVRK